jgi:hypothetical protein
VIPIAVTQAAFDAIAASMAFGSVNYEPQVKQKGRTLDLAGRTLDQQAARPTRSRGELQRRDHPAGGGGAMRRVLFLALALTAAPAAAGEMLTCETQGDRRHCFDQHGYLSTEERSGDYVHGWNNRRGAWTEWEHDGRTYSWPSR